MLVSTFELLVKSQLPKEFPAPAPFDKLARTVIQGYFLTIANTSDRDVEISLDFYATTPNLDINSTVTFLDVQGTNNVGDLSIVSAGKATCKIAIPKNDTCLFILQPDILANGGKLLKDSNFEVRGYVDIDLIRPADPRTVVKLMVSAEHRGTFFNSKIVDDPNADLRLDQFVCNLPLANESSVYNFRDRGNQNERSAA